jgi:hypothetical protein
VSARAGSGNLPFNGGTQIVYNAFFNDTSGFINIYSGGQLVLPSGSFNEFNLALAQ